MSNLSLQQFTASARKHTKYISQPSSSQNLAAKPCKQKKKNYIESSIVKVRN